MEAIKIRKTQEKDIKQIAEIRVRRMAKCI